MKKLWIILLAVAAMVLISAPAHATGSDSPTPYTVGVDGVTLPEGDSFPAHGHINVKFTDSEGNNEQSKGIHFDPNNNQPGGAWIGESFIPWTAFGLTDDFCITWVQIHGYNQHYGEGKHKSVCIPPVNPCVEDPYAPGCEIPPAPEPWNTTEERVSPVVCEVGGTGFGTIITETREGIREFEWVEEAWSWILPLEWAWTDWTVTSKERVESVLCEPISETGGELSPGLITGAGALVMAGLALLFYRKQKEAQIEGAAV